MRLIKARVQNYRSIEDSGWVDIGLFAMERGGVSVGTFRISL